MTEKLAAARRRIAELEAEMQQREDLEDLEAQIRRLEDIRAPIVEPVAPPAARLVRRAPKTRELPTYKGKSIKEAQDFFYQAELKWREDGGITWATDAAKVTHCASCFEGIARDIWKRRERSVGVNTTDWETFVEFMKDSILDPENRSNDALAKFKDAKQRPGQSVQSFVSYLDSLSDDLGYTGSPRERDDLFSGLRQEIRDEINRQGNAPREREKLISAAVRVENNLNQSARRERNDEPTGQRKEGNWRKERGDNKGKRKRSVSPSRGSHNRGGESIATGSNAVPASGSVRPGVTCFTCQKEGHYATTCPNRGKSTCYNCNKSGHKAYECPEPKKPGNGRAPQ